MLSTTQKGWGEGGFLKILTSQVQEFTSLRFSPEKSGFPRTYWTRRAGIYQGFSNCPSCVTLGDGG